MPKCRTPMDVKQVKFPLVSVLSFIAPCVALPKCDHCFMMRDEKGPPLFMAE